MDRGLKERLVGAAVLVALAVIFIPMLLDDSPSGPGPITGTNIPERPDAEDGFSSRIIPVKPEPVEVELPESRVADDAAAEPQTAEPVSQPPPAEGGAEAPESDAATATEPSGDEQEPALTTAMPAPETATDTGKPSGWVIQLGSFSQETNARELDEKLREAGYPAFVEPVTQSGKRVYRVRVGPEVMRGDAEKVRDKIATDFDIKGIVVSYP